MDIPLTQALDQLRCQALVKYPDEETRITLGYSIARAGGVELLPDGTAMVASETLSDTRYAVKKGFCPCNDATYRPQHAFCKHRAARQMIINALRMIASSETELHTTRTGTQYYTHADHENVTILLGKKTIADAQRLTDGDLVRKAAGYGAYPA